jgi:predicted AAA+ superfamily ATPase
MFNRALQTQLRTSMADTPVSFIAGARQTGKSTLIQAFQAELPGSRYASFDDLNTLAGARRDPVGFVADLPPVAFLDEVQRVPELFLPIKASVDRDRRPGRFILTGSANVMALPKVADSLAGRMEILTLWPLAQGELQGTQAGFIDACFRGEPRSLAMHPLSRRDLLAVASRGGYPEAIQRPTAEERTRWFDGYLTTLVQRDLRELSDIQGLQEIPRLLGTLAARAGSTLNLSDLARGLSISLMTVKRYLAFFHTLYLLVVLPPWSENLGKRLVKAPKVYLNDSALLAHLLGLGEAGLEALPGMTGPVLETFVVMELVKTAPLSRLRPTLSHFRTAAGAEVDIVLETRRRDLVGIEVKASSTVQASDFKGLQELRGMVGDRLKAGVVLYTGSETVPFGNGLWAMPVPALWSPGA